MKGKSEIKLDGSDWSEDSDDDQNEEAPEQKEDGKVLEDGTIQIELETKGKKSYGPNGPRFWQEDPKAWREAAEQREIRRIINQEKTAITQFGHQLSLLAFTWVGLEWDKLCDCPLIQGKILSMLTKTKNLKNAANLKTFLAEMNSLYHFPTADEDSGIPSPVGGLIMLDNAISSTDVDEKTKWTKTTYGNFQNFIRTALIVAGARTCGAVARLCLNVTTIHHKPQSKNQEEARKVIYRLVFLHETQASMIIYLFKQINF